MSISKVAGDSVCLFCNCASRLPVHLSITLILLVKTLVLTLDKTRSGFPSHLVQQGMLFGFRSETKNREGKHKKVLI